MENKLQDAELKVMNVLWEMGDLPAREIAGILSEKTGWNVNTTYTLIKRCIKKGAIERSEPNFMCHAAVPIEQVQEFETNALIDKVFGGSADRLFASLLSSKKLSGEQLSRLKEMVEKESQ